MLEIEIKSRCDHDEVKRKLEDMGAERLDTLYQSDVYLRHPCRDFASTDEALRIRNDGNGTVLYYKGPRTSERSKGREEISVPLNDADEMMNVLERLGFQKAFVVEKTRTPHILRDCEVSLDSVEGLGEFVEIEFIGTGDDGEEVVNAVADLLGVEGNETRSYLELRYFPVVSDE